LTPRCWQSSARNNRDAELPRWTLHDLRRTARSLMPSGVWAMFCLGSGAPTIVTNTLPKSAVHSMALAALIERIVNPADNVVALSESRAKAVPASI
jgi:hypothetical protein